MNVRLALTIALLASLVTRASFASDAGYSTISVKMGAGLAQIYTGTHTDREWVTQWRQAGPRATRNVTFEHANADGTMNGTTITYFGCTLESAEAQALTINCASSMLNAPVATR